MSILSYNSSNKIKNSGVLFHGKRAYHDSVMSQDIPNYIDLWYSRPLHGKVDRDFNLVHVDGTNLKPVKGAHGREDIYALNFVADAFNAMVIYLQDLEIKRKILPGCFFHPMTAHGGWVGVNRLYLKHMQEVYELFVNEYIRKGTPRFDRQIHTFESFLPIFVNFLNFLTEQRTPFTKSGFISSLNCPYNASGLVIEIAREVDFSDDLKKYANYFQNSEEFSIYSDVTKKFGFFIDMNAPWRLVADLDSPAWRENQILDGIVRNYFIPEEGPEDEGPPIEVDTLAELFGGGSTDEVSTDPSTYSVQEVFDKFYHRTFDSGVQALKVYAMQFYNSLVAEEPTVFISQACRNVHYLRRKYSPGQKAFEKVVERRVSTMRELDMTYSDLFWLKLFVRIRLREMQCGTEKFETASIIKQVEHHYHSAGYASAEAYVSGEMSGFLEEQVSELNSLRLERKNLLINEHVSAIIL